MTPRQHLEQVYQMLIYNDLLDTPLDKEPKPEAVEAQLRSDIYQAMKGE